MAQPGGFLTFPDPKREGLLESGRVWVFQSQIHTGPGLVLRGGGGVEGELYSGRGGAGQTIK